MSLAFLDPYHDTDSPIHELDATFKLVFTLCLILIINLTPITLWPAHLCYLLFILAIAVLARATPRSLLSRSMLVLPFALMASIGLPFVREGTVIASVPMPWGRLGVTDVGMIRFANVMAKSWLSILASITLVSSTPFVEIARGFRSIGLPGILVSVILMMYRYIFVLVDEAQSMLRARDARSVEIEGARSGGTLRWRAQVTGRMIGTLFLRTYERSERIYQAMLARGYDGQLRTLGHRRLSRRALALGGLSLSCLITLALLTSRYWLATP